ncbi:MAG: hypothetical protein ACTHK4_15145 [Mycobacteriales bacterium]
MPVPRLTLIGSILGVVGAALLIAEASRAALGHAVLSSTSQLLMWIGLGLGAVGGVLVICGVWSSPREPVTD